MGFLLSRQNIIQMCSFHAPRCRTFEKSAHAIMPIFLSFDCCVLQLLRLMKRYVLPTGGTACRWSHFKNTERDTTEENPHHSPRKYALISSSEGSAGSGSRPGMHLVASYSA